MTTQKIIVIKDRVEIYKDFTINLLNYIVAYYIDRKSLSDEVDMKNHYNWCYNKVCAEFLEEEIDFRNNTELRDYFYSYFYHQFYELSSGHDKMLSAHDKFWRGIFDIEKQKNKNLLDVLVEIYLIYDKSVNLEKTFEKIV